ncbi:MAG: hypothetical protein Q9188_007482 [Gyalolechia gomerana]
MNNDRPLKPEASPTQAPTPPPPLIIKADELDTTGTDVTIPIPDIASPITPALQGPPHSPQPLSGQPLSSSPRAVPVRPILRRDGSTSAPPSESPPTPLQQQQTSETGGQQATDSLSLLQLRQLATNLPKLEPQAYAYEHADTRSFAEEIEEWFPYSEEERYMLLRGKEAFETQWGRRNTTNKWTDVAEEERVRFVHSLVQNTEKQEEEVEAIECLAYLAMGCWGETAGLEQDEAEDSITENSKKDQWGGMSPGQFAHSAVHIEWIIRGCKVLVGCGAVKCIFDTLSRACDGEQSVGPLPLMQPYPTIASRILLTTSRDTDQAAHAASMNGEEQSSLMLHRFLAINQALTVLYLIVEVGRCGPTETMSSVQKALGDREDEMARFTAAALHKGTTRARALILLYWKVILLDFGTSDDLKHSKRVLRNRSDSREEDDNAGFIVASPLDYHLFRQELTSKYPAYNPPPPLLPIEPENTSILPPLPHHPSRRTSQENNSTASGPTGNGIQGSIFVQPVHIATPAPSPPPSPAGPGGKGGKKQNYQTNQNFPFLYPPLDETSNTMGGKGNAELQDQLVGKRWEGSDVPASILEAGQLFASRMRMSRSIRQLWDVRERFIRHERGWDEFPKDNVSNGSSGSMIEEDDSDEDGDTADQVKSPVEEAKAGAETSDKEVQRRLDVIGSFYRNALPQLQSVVLVLWKSIFTNVSCMAAQGNGSNGLGVPNGISFPDDHLDHGPVKRKMNVRSAVQEGMVNGNPAEFEDEADPVLEELNSMRLREISSKAISAILLMLLKWFKLSHILKYEYLTQLLLDANFLPLILKYFAHQDIDRAVDQKIDRDDLKYVPILFDGAVH